MKNRLFLLSVVVLLLAACSHVSQTATAQKTESAAIVTVDRTVARQRARASDYNRMLDYALSLPPSPAVIGAAREVVGLQFNLLGPGSQSEQADKDFMAHLVVDDAQAHELLAQASTDDENLASQLAKVTQDRDEKVAVLHALATSDAAAHDSLDTWIHRLWIVLLIGIGLTVFLALIKLGIITGTTAGKIAEKVP